MSAIDFTIYPNKRVVEIDTKHTVIKPRELLDIFNAQQIPLGYRIRFTDLTFKNIKEFLKREYITLGIGQKEED